MSESTLQLGEAADEADWRALVEQGLKGAKLGTPSRQNRGRHSAGAALSRADIHTATRYFRHAGRGAVRARYGQERLAYSPELCPSEYRAHQSRKFWPICEGGVGAIELVIDAGGKDGVAIKSAADLDLALADVILEAAPVSLDAGADGERAAMLLRDKLKGVAVGWHSVQSRSDRRAFAHGRRARRSGAGRLSLHRAHDARSAQCALPARRCTHPS
jgi:hypothetical protein